MKIFASKPTKQDIFISVIIFLCGILFCFGISKFKGVGKEHNIKSDTILIKKDSITYSDSLAIFSLVGELKAREGYRDTFYNHPSQKPLALMRKLIIENTNKGDTIFDPFMGSGTTAIAAMMEGRNFIGCEINNEYFQICTKRAGLLKDAPTLF